MKIKSIYIIIILFYAPAILSKSNSRKEKRPKKEGSSHPGDGKPFGSSGPYVTIPETSDISTRDFFAQYVKTKRALLIKGMAAHFPAFRLWSSDEYLKEAAANARNRDFKLLVETQKKESRDQNVIGLTLDEFIDEYKRKEIYIVDQVPEFLKPDLLLPQQLQCAQAPTVLEQTMLWFSSGGTKSVTHTDDYENIMCLFAGTKEFVMVDYFKYKSVINRIIDEPRGTYSTMDVDKVDYDLFPGIETLEYYRFNVSAGDCVYIPFKWLHQVRSYNRNIAVNYWFNFEKIFGNSGFPEECASNKLDLNKPLSSYNYSTNKNDFYVNFKFYIMRQVNMGSRTIKDWFNLIYGSANNDSESDIKQNIQDITKEFFDLIDFNGDGYLSDEEVLELDENSLEHSAGLLNDIDELIYSKIAESEESQKPGEEDENEEIELVKEDIDDNDKIEL